VTWQRHRSRSAGKAAVVAAAAAFAFTPVAEASCIRMTSAEQRANARVIFEGIALDSPTATGVQRFRVTRYLKGSGPARVRVATGEVRSPGGGGVVTSVSIHVVRGEKWRIFSRDRAQRVMRTSVCDGSKRLARA
jgi:hypothetical protein